MKTSYLIVLCTCISVACARTNTSTAPSITPSVSPACCSAEGHHLSQQYRVAVIDNRRFTHAQLWSALDPVTRSPNLQVREIGRSIQGRAIRAITFGAGRTTVLL